MKNRLKHLLIDLLPLVLWLGAGVFLASQAIVKFELRPIRAILISFLGLVLNYYACLFFHELGHYVFARHNKMSVQKIKLGFMAIDVKNKKLKFASLDQTSAGGGEFSASGKISERQLKVVTFGGILFNAIYALAVFTVIILVKNPTVFCLFGIGGISACYLLTVNLLPFDKTSDGAILMGGEYPSAVVQTNNLFASIAANESLEKSEFITNSKQPLAVYCNFFITSLTSAEEALKLVDGLKIEDLVTDQEYSLLFPEILFSCCVAGRISDGLKTRAENYFSVSDFSVSDLRAHYAYRVTMGEIEWAKSIKSSYDQMLKNAEEQRRISENNLFSLFLQKLD